MCGPSSFSAGWPEVVVPDNLKSAVTHPSYYEPDLNPTYRDLGEHAMVGADYSGVALSSQGQG